MTVHRPEKRILDEIIRRIVDVAHPERIILFGSAVRGEMNEDSDLDLIIVKQGDYNPRAVAAEIYLRLFGVGQAVDLIVITPEQIEEYRYSPYYVLYPALQEGKVVYDASSAAA
jgi:predicted nucleotidyltransferase